MKVAVASAGTAVTAVAPGVVHALIESGFTVSGDHTLGNPPLRVRGHGIDRQLQSKTVGEAVARVSGPTNVVALMVCAAADASCPHVKGVGFQTRLPYTDPKSSDRTEGERAAYAKTSADVKAEMRWLVRALQEALASERGTVPRV